MIAKAPAVRVYRAYKRVRRFRGEGAAKLPGCFIQPGVCLSVCLPCFMVPRIAVFFFPSHGSSSIFLVLSSFPAHLSLPRTGFCSQWCPLQHVATSGFQGAKRAADWRGRFSKRNNSARRSNSLRIWFHALIRVCLYPLVYFVRYLIYTSYFVNF